MYELSQLSLKFERHLDSEIIDFQVLYMLAKDYNSPRDSVLWGIAKYTHSKKCNVFGIFNDGLFLGV